MLDALRFALSVAENDTGRAAETMNAARATDDEARARYDESGEDADLEALVKTSAKLARAERLHADAKRDEDAKRDAVERRVRLDALEQTNETYDAIHGFGPLLVARYGRRFARLDALLNVLAHEVADEVDALAKQVHDTASVADALGMSFEGRAPTIDDAREAIGVGIDLWRTLDSRDSVDGWLDGVTRERFAGSSIAYEKLVTAVRTADEETDQN